MKHKRALQATIFLLTTLVGAAWLLVPLVIKVRQSQIHQQLVGAVKARNVSNVRDCLREGGDPNIPITLSQPVSLRQYLLQLFQHREPSPETVENTPVLMEVLNTEEDNSPPSEMRKRADIALLLLHSGADPNANGYGPGLWTCPLVCAAQLELWDVVKVLVQHGAEVNVEEGDGNGYTPLIMAAEANQTEVALMLLEHGAAPDTPTRHSGYTATMLAALNGNEVLIRALLKKKVNLALTDKDGDTALAYARRKKHGQIAVLLKRYGARK